MSEQQIINIERAAKIAGFMSNAELAWLASQALTHNRIVEVGSLIGRSTRALADHTEGFVLAVDDFKGPRDTTMSWKERQSIPGRFEGHLRDHLDSGKVIVWKQDYGKLDIGECPAPSRTFDMCFIDGCHKFSSVTRDIAFWRPLLEEGALICGHDFSLEYPQVIEAVTNAFGNGVTPIPNTTIWWHVVPVTVKPVAQPEEMAVV